MKFAIILIILAASQLSASPAYAGPGPGQYTCRYRGDRSGKTFEAYSREKALADEYAFDKCGGLASLAKENGNCSFQGCENPKTCEPESADNPNQTKRSLQCNLVLLEAPKKEAIKKITDYVRTKAKDKLDQAGKAALEAKLTADAVNRINNSFLPTFSELSREYSTLALHFKNQYSPSYGTTSDDLKNKAKKASKATWRDLVAMRIDLAQILLNEQDTSMQYQYATALLQRKIETQCQFYTETIQPVAASAQKLNIPTAPPAALCEKARGRLEDMKSYSATRIGALSSAINTLTNSIETSITIQKANEVDAVTRQAKADAAQLRASAEFAKQVNDRVKTLWAPLKKKESVDLEYFGERYNQLLAFKGFSKQCKDTSSNPAWMDTGCLSVQRETQPVEQFLAKTLLQNIRFNIQIIQRQSQTPELQQILRQLNDALSKQNLEDAVMLYDFALNALG